MSRMQGGLSQVDGAGGGVVGVGRAGGGAGTGEEPGRSVLPSPRAPRLRRPGWRDPRLLLGLALVGLSVLLGSWAVGSAGRTVQVLAAGEALVPGDPLRAAMLRVVDVRLPDGGADYLPTDADLDALVVTRVVREGELVPSSAVASEGEIGARAVAVTTGAGVSSAVVEGALVDLWFVPDPPSGSGDGDAPQPRQLAASLTVAEVDASSAAFSVGAGSTVHVLVPLDDLPAVLAAVRGAGTVDLVPVPGGTS